MEVLFTEFNDIVAESADQDQTAHMCSLILIYTLRLRVHCREQQNKG